MNQREKVYFLLGAVVKRPQDMSVILYLIEHKIIVYDFPLSEQLKKEFNLDMRDLYSILDKLELNNFVEKLGTDIYKLKENDKEFLSELEDVIDTEESEIVSLINKRKERDIYKEHESWFTH